MTVATAVSRTSFVSNGSATVYPFPFRILAAADLVVATRSASIGSETILSYPAQYSVSGVGNGLGGSITLVAPVTAGDTLVIRRVRPILQQTSFRSQGSFFPESHEDAIDNVTMIAQQLDDTLRRSVRLDDTLDPALYDLTLPDLTAGKVVTGTGSGLTMSALDTSAVALPGGGRTVSTLSAYLANNAIFNIRDFGATNAAAGATNTTAINAAVTAANAAGGGMALADTGTFNIAGSVLMKTGVLLVIGPNAQIRRTDTSSARAVYFGPGVVNAGLGGTGVIYGPDVAPTSIADGSVVIFEGCDSCYTTPGLQVQGGKVAGIALLAASTNCTIDRPVHTLLNVAANQSDNADIYLRYGQSGHRILYPKCLSTLKRGGIGIQPLADGVDITDITIIGAQVRYCNGTNGHGIFGYVGTGGGWLRRIRVFDSIVEDTDNMGLYFIGQLSGIDDLRLERITLRRNVKVGTAGTLMDSAIALSNVTFGRVADITFEGTSGVSWVNPSYGLRMIGCDSIDVSLLKGRFLKGMAIAVWSDSTSTNCTFDDINLVGQAGVTAFKLEGTGHTVGTLIARDFQNGLTTGTTTDLIVQRLVTRTISNAALSINGSSTNTKLLSHDSDGSGTITDAGVRTRMPMGSATTDTDGLLKLVQQFQLSGAATSIARMLFGSSSAVGSISTGWASGDLIIAQNAYPNLGADSWHQALATSPSRCIRIANNGNVSIYAAAIGVADGAFAAFWGTAEVQLNVGGSAGMLFDGVQVIGARGAAVADVASANATDLATAITLVNEIKAQFNTSLARSRAHGLIA